jgi:CheY-like chemotaxis protein
MSKCIFLIEDDPSIIEVYQTALEESGFKVEVLVSGEEAMTRIKEIGQEKIEKPDLILLDYILPGLDGIEILKEIRNNKNTKDLKVFITTNYSIEQLKQKKKVIAKGERFVLKADYPPSKMMALIKKELGE